MAILKTANGNGKYTDTNAKENVISYILNPYKAKQYSGSMYITNADPIADMERISRQFGKENGIQLRHFIISFDPEETTDPRVVAAIACEIIPYLGREYQLVFAVHEDKPHLHIHIVSNSVSYVDGHRYYGTRQEFNGFKAHIKQVLRRYGIQTLQYVPNRIHCLRISKNFFRNQFNRILNNVSITRIHCSKPVFRILFVIFDFLHFLKPP